MAQDLHYQDFRRIKMHNSDQDPDFIGPIKPLMNMSYRDYLQMINTGVGLPRLPARRKPTNRTNDDFLFPPKDYLLN